MTHIHGIYLWDQSTAILASTIKYVSTTATASIVDSDDLPLRSNCFPSSTPSEVFPIGDNQTCAGDGGKTQNRRVRWSPEEITCLLSLSLSLLYTSPLSPSRPPVTIRRVDWFDNGHPLRHTCPSTRARPKQSIPQSRVVSRGENQTSRRPLRPLRRMFDRAFALRRRRFFAGKVPSISHSWRVGVRQTGLGSRRVMGILFAIPSCGQV